MYLSKAKELLYQEYGNACHKTEETSYPRAFSEEKFRHSYQVLGAGNYILKHEPVFSSCNPAEIDRLKATVLLHDIARFQEILYKEQGVFIDHGVYGAKMLEKDNLFNDIQITLPIKHHGHLIEELYSDDSYKTLTPNEQENIKNISFLVRDADKLANLYLLIHSFDEVEKIFFTEKQDEKKPTPEVLQNFMAQKSIHKKLCRSAADHALMITAWLFDIGFKSSFEFMEKLNIIENMFARFAKFWQPENIAIYKNEIRRFIIKKYETN